MPIKILLTAASLALGLATSTHAAPTPRPSELETVSVRVALADLDLEREAGARTALQRIRNAARRVCGGGLSGPMLGLSTAYRSCQREAIDRAVASLDRPLVTAMNLKRPQLLQVAGG